MTNRKIGLLFLFAFFGFLLWAGTWIFSADFSQGQPRLGVTFSPRYAIDLELDWQQAYLAILDELKVDRIRLSAYWDTIEPEPDVYDFSELDWQVAEALQRNVNIILAIGRRLPRWPECHEPDWLNQEELDTELLAYLRAVVERYRDQPNIVMWQVENEPLLSSFGICPKPDRLLFDQEVALVKSLDDRPVMSTDSGELSFWIRSSKNVDVLGHTVYRIVWNKWIGFWDYFFLPPAYYTAKAELIKFLRPNLESVVVSELQMEPWTTGRRMVELTLEEQQRSFDLERFHAHLAYAKRTGAPELNLWGVEYWYWLKVNGHPEIWEAARTLWNGSE